MTRQRRPFLGREAELALLREALDDAMAGQGSVVAIAGEPGIGKTRLVEEFAGRARDADALLLHGRCYEDDWAPPYSPFVEAIEAYAREHSGEIAAAERVEVASIVPGMEDAVPGEEPPRGPEERKYRLYQAVLRMLQDAAAARTLCLVLEDLHDADGGTLELLVHLGRNLRSGRLLMVGTFRDTGVAAGHPLGTALAEIDRASPVRRVSLSGLSLPEATDLVAAEAGIVVPVAVANDAWVRTDGHPLFLRELARVLVANDTSTVPVPRELPASLRESIGVRLAGLSADCRKLLEHAAVIGHEAALATLRRVSPLDNEALSAALREAIAAGVLDERTGEGDASYRFHHGLFREALYHGLMAPRRNELHIQIGQALEAVLGNSPGHAAELAEHLAHSFDPGDVLRAAGYAEVAAKRAASVYSWANAVAWYERALELLDRAGPTERERRCDLLLGLAEMLLNNSELPRLEDEVAEEAFQLAVSIEDPVRAATAAMLALRSMFQRGLYPALQTERGDTWAPRAVRYATSDDAARLRARFFAAMNQGRWADLPAILDGARNTNDPDLFHSVAALAMKNSPALDNREQAIATEILLRRDEEASADAVATSSYFAGLAFATWGNLDAARTAFERVLRLSRQRPVAGALAYGLCADASLRILAGDLESAVDLWNEPPESEGRVMMRSALTMPLRWLGRVDELRSMQPMPGPWHGYYGVVTGDVERARAAFDYMRLQITSSTGVDPSQNPWSVRGTLGHAVPLFVLEGAMLLGDRETVRMLLNYAQTNWRPVAAWWPFQVSDRCIGDGLAFLGDWPGARARYESALALARDMRFRPEIALSHLGLAETLHAGSPGEGGAVREHLDACLPEFEAMRMRPALERARALLDQLDDAPSAHPNGLSAREVEVLRLLALGKRNREIADALVISPATVARHVSNILAKTWLSNRTELAGYAMAQGLLGD